MATIIKDVELFENCKNVEEVRESIKNAVEGLTGGHVVESYDDAEAFFAEIFGEDRQPAHSGDSQYSHITLHCDDTPIRIVIEEIVSDPEADTDYYCYMVSVEEE